MKHRLLPAVGWLHELRRRTRVLSLVKMAGTTVGISLFFVAYFWVMRHTPQSITTMPLIPMDEWVDFQPAALPLYASLWFYVSMAPALLNDAREVRTYALSALLLSLIGLAIFWLWPSKVPEFDIDWARHASVAFLKSADVAGNACPSLHAAFAVFTAAWFERLFRQTSAGLLLRGLNLLWCVGILYATLAVRQHVALDMLAGSALGGVMGWLSLLALDRRPATRAAADAASLRAQNVKRSPGTMG